MNSKPIIFSGDSVAKILEGLKTQTRRVVKVQPPPDFAIMLLGSDARVCWADLPDESFMDCWPDEPIRAPYQVGDYLWVKEKWRFGLWTEDGSTVVRYDGNASRFCDGAEIPHEWHKRKETANRRWRSPRFMPKWASRLTIRVTDVRLERLQAISEDDVVAEGYDYRELTMPDDPRLWFRTKWDEINGKRSPWARNDWVWVYTFEVVK